MELQPVNVFVRGAEDFGEEAILTKEITLYRYLSDHIHQHRPIIDGEVLNLPYPTFLTPYGFYTPEEAVRSLALPGPDPTHVLCLILVCGDVVRGPAWVEPLSRTVIRWNQVVHRPGNGLEFVLVDPAPLFLADRVHEVKSLVGV